MRPDKIRFFENDNKLPFLAEFDAMIIPHLGSDVVISDRRYFVTDVLIQYLENETVVDVIVERVNE